MRKLNTITLVHISDAGTTSQEIEVAAILPVLEGWTDYSACAAIEGFDGEVHDQNEILSAWQHLIDSGTVWSLQGTYGRTAEELIDQGLCHLR